jgi:hypothetical protein
MHLKIPSDQEWAYELTSWLPSNWRKRLLSRWERLRAQGKDFVSEIESAREANIQLRETVQTLNKIRLPLNATDQDIIDRSEFLANQCMMFAAVYHDPILLRATMSRKAIANSIEPPDGKGMTDTGAIARMSDSKWWRRQLRKLHAKTVESSAIKLGYVNKTRDIYASGESVHRRIQQNKRNANILEATIAVNENGQEFTLAELAATSTANKAIRRAELMTRISGFEIIAKDMNHVGSFMTVTCPSRMHRFRTVNNGKVIENQKYDGTNPAQAQKYLSKVWAQIRASLARQKINLYGFRVAEPQHDGTPHWHFLIFHEADKCKKIESTVWKYALKDSANEKGANEHRVDFKAIDPQKGTAAGYIAKYIAKNIDGLHVGNDLYGNPALETSLRVETWATTWGIRQFQQVGGAPVSVWRELRRIKTLPEGIPDFIRAAWLSVNKTKIKEHTGNESVAWDEYINAQGGAFCGRKYRIRLALQDKIGLGCYGEPLGKRPIGIESTVREHYTPEHMKWMNGTASRLVEWFIESTRYVWEIRQKKCGTAAPWTGVNNCTVKQIEKPHIFIDIDQIDGYISQFSKPPDKKLMRDKRIFI